MSVPAYLSQNRKMFILTVYRNFQFQGFAPLLCCTVCQAHTTCPNGASYEKAGVITPEKMKENIFMFELKPHETY